MLSEPSYNENLMALCPGTVSYLCLKYKVTVASHERHGISNNWQLHCLFNLLHRHAATKHFSTGHLWGNPLITSGLLSQRASNAESVSMAWHNHEPIWQLSQWVTDLHFHCFNLWLVAWHAKPLPESIVNRKQFHIQMYNRQDVWNMTNILFPSLVFTFYNCHQIVQHKLNYIYN